MAGEILCTVCGNEVDPSVAICPFCKETRDPECGVQGVEQFRVINLERGMPIVRDALKRLALELETASRTGLRALVLIHGYGSSGKGGAIKDAVRGQLQLSLDRGTLSEVLPGEKCGRRSGSARQIMKRFPFLEEFVQQSNPGITLVII
jgi:hypothetical protein